MESKKKASLETFVAIRFVWNRLRLHRSVAKKKSQTKA